MAKSKLRIAGGYVMIGLGVIGVLLPVVPQVPFFIAGAALLGHDHKLIKGARAWLHKRGFKIFKDPEKEFAAKHESESLDPRS